MGAAPEFTEFVAARTPALLRTAYLLAGDWAAGEDLLQTTLEQCWRRWGRLGEHPEPYVRQAMLRTFLSWRRRRWTGETPTEELPEVVAADPMSAYDEREQLWRALQRLPRRQRAVIVLRYFDDLSEQETAAALGVAVGTVKSQSSKALAALRVDESLVLGMDGVS